MFGVGDRRTPSRPGGAGRKSGQCAVSVMTYLNPEPRMPRGNRLLSGEGFLAPDFLPESKEEGGASDPRLAVVESTIRRRSLKSFVDKFTTVI